MSNPPSRGSGQGVKTVGKHEVPLVNVEQEKANGSGYGRGPMGEDVPRQVINKNLTRSMDAAGQLINSSPFSRSFPNASSLGSSPVSTPGAQRRQLPPSGIKLPVPPPSFLNGLHNVHKSASSASLNLHAVAGVSPSAGQSDRLRETVTVPNASEMLAAARAELMNGAGGGGVKPQRPALSRLPPLQLPKAAPPTRKEEAPTKMREGGNDDGEKREEKEGGGGGGGSGPIATMATESMPQMKALEPLKIPMAGTPIVGLEPPSPQGDAASSAPPSYPASIAATSPIPPMPLSTRIPPLHHGGGGGGGGPNEVPIHHHPPLPHQHNARRRPSSAGQINPLALASHKPLPSISQPTKGMARPVTGKKLHQGRSRQWRMAIKCGIVLLLLCIPVVIFLVMLLFSDVFSSSSSSSSASNSSSSTQMPMTTTTTLDAPIATTATTTTIVPTAINIVGGAIFAPISMQNETTHVFG